jgi:hypothetical protein
MIRALLLAWVIIWGSSASLAQAPPGGAGGMQPTKTGDYTVKSSDLKTTIPFNCATPCTVTMPKSTSSWSKQYSVTILNLGPITVTIHATPTSIIQGMGVAPGGDILLTASGNYATLQANSANNYVAIGVAGAPIAPPPTGSLVLRNSGGHVLRNGGGSVQRNDSTTPLVSMVLRNGGGHVIRNGGGSIQRNVP